MSATRNPVPQDGQRDQSHPSDRLPAWQRVLVVVAHPDDESFGLGAVIDAFVTAGAQVEVLCLTMGEASTLAEGLSPQSVGELPAMRAQELARAADLLGVRRATLVRHPDGALGQQPAGALEADVEAAVDRVAPHGLVVFGNTSVTFTVPAVGSKRTRSVKVPPTSMPATIARPLVMVMSVVSMRTVVDFPAPLGPRKPKIPPGSTESETPRTACTSPSLPL